MQWLDQQRLFKQALDSQNSDAAEMFREKANLPAALGLRIYRDAYAIRMREFIADDYPVCTKLLGRRFAKFCREYSLLYPSSSPSATDFGRHFSEFLTNKKWIAADAYFPELAKFEWLLNEVPYAPELAASGLEKIAAAGEEDWLDARLIFDPSLRLLECSFPVDEIYENEAAAGPKSCKLLIWRELGSGCYRRLEAAEFELLDILSRGVSLRSLANKEAELDPVLFSDWLSSGILRGIHWLEADTCLKD